MNCIGADPFVFLDPKSGLFYFYATDSREENNNRTFIIYRGQDLTHLEYVGYALDMKHNRWGKDWFWAPVVLYNPHNDLYYLFYSARVKDELLEKYFADPHFEEGCKIGMATSKSPEGPFKNVCPEPIDYCPFDTNYLDVTSICDNPKHPNVSFQKAFDDAKRGTYVPLIDIDLFFDADKLYFYFSRCCFNNYVFDPRLGKFIEESHIVAAEFDPHFWFDKKGKEMPKLVPNLRNDNKDSYFELIAYWREPQEWENSHVDDFNQSHGERKDRRWSEGSTVFKKYIEGNDVYFMTYSCNNYENEFYGVGIAYSLSPLGPFKKYPNNPIIHQNEKENIYSTGHGSYLNLNGKDYYVFHMRDDKKGERCLAWCELFIKSKDDISISEIHKCELINH